MANIEILHPEVRSKIAAGEVIARPNSVVKELLENSIDAYAKRIDIVLKDGGKQEILVNDDGCGMGRDDAVLAIERYATSKLKHVSDLEHITTYGFRGEALASIAEISHFEMETSDGSKGSKIIIQGGELKDIMDSHRPQGTRVRVSHLFFNLPVRSRFLKSGQWERRLITDVVRSYALINPSIYFSLHEQDRKILDFGTTSSLEERVKLHFPKQVVDFLVYINIKVGAVRFNGFLTRPDFFERHHMNYLYVNGRPVKYPRLYRTIANTYQNPKTPPGFVLNIEVAPNLVDVNIHPTKQEVKFRDERYVFDLLGQAIKTRVFAGPGRPNIKTSRSDITQTHSNKPDTKFVQETVLPYSSENQVEPLTSRESKEFWQLHDTYILSQTKSGLVIVDQHVAHERIIYESITKGKSGSQRLLFPITLELTPEEYRAYRKTKLLLKELGIEFKEFSAHTIVIDSLPASATANREDMLDLFKELDGLGNLIKQRNEIAKVVACKGAIKAGQKLSVEEMRSLIDRLFACENPYTCPHGRPIIIRFSLDELATRFGR
jgi:DNA mismatch repair protein MutL